MALYRIFRLKDSLRAQFRQLPHMSGVAKIKAKDYEENTTTVEAPTPYAAWFALKGTEQELAVGDVLAEENGEVRIIKFVGFEPAEWVVPEVKVPGELLNVPPSTGAASL
ncbi:hypothetical protein F183_A46460 [Bryobacterales bacterium F-183]|nr:hypothetical protein F183_A46460 [Bryobacterales bacterium F-183]